MRTWIIGSAVGLIASCGTFTGMALGQAYNPPPAGQPAAPAAPAAPGQAMAPAPAGSEAAEQAAVLAALSGTTHSLASGITQVAVGTEVPIEAKFEVEDGVLYLSVYTSEKGLGTIAEENVFKEYKGDAAAAAWAPETEVFEDFAHIARSAQYHTLLSMTDVTIPDIIEAAEADGATVFSVKPKVVDGKPMFEVLSALEGVVEENHYDLLTGQPVA